MIIGTGPLRARAAALALLGQFPEVEASAREALANRGPLVAESPIKSRERLHLEDDPDVLIGLLRRAGRRPEGRAEAARAVAVREALVEEEPANGCHRAALARLLRRRALALRDPGEPAATVEDTRRAAARDDGLAGLSWEECFEAARATLHGLSRRDAPGVSPSDATHEAAAALALLVKAAGRGVRCPETYRAEDALDLLRGRDDFRLLMRDLGSPADPFAR